MQVFHGATSDVIWLQRDFGLYLVSLFDTYHASNALQLPSKSLAYLLAKYANIEADKKYQLADWRIRPLPKEMMAYARSDTHYLLSIYDQLRNDLTQRSTENTHDLIKDVLDASRKTAMITYRRERYDAEEGSGVDGWRKLLLNAKGPKLHSSLQLMVFKRVHQWRDQLAREEDESVNYVLPNRSLMNLAASLPHSMQSVVAACHPVPPLVQVYAEDIAYIVQKTRKELAEEASKAEVTFAKSVAMDVDSSVKNGVTGATHVWYKDESAAPTGVRSVMEAIQHGAQFDMWGNSQDRVHSLVMSTSKFWEPLQRDYDASDPIHDVGGELEDVKLSVPLPPLTAQIYLTAEDVVVKETETKVDNVAALAEHPFVQRSKEEKAAQNGSEIIIARKLGKKERKRERPKEEEESSYVNGETVPSSPDAKAIRTKTKNKRQRGLKEKVEAAAAAATVKAPIEHFDPYKIDIPPPSKPHKPYSSKDGGKSMTFKS
jgi:exosome complex exonuclease RRP6